MLIITCLRILGILLMIFSVTLLPPIFVATFYHEGIGIEEAFITAMAITFLTGLILWLPFRHKRRQLRTRDGFLIVVLFWSVLSLFGAIPFVFIGNSITDAVFESVSGLTTTGSTVLSNLDSLPHAVLYYRQQLQMLGGLGIIVLAVAILPLLGIGGMQLFRAETTGPVKDNKLTPRITQTAKVLWLIYGGLIISCALAYWWGGMSLFDAVSYSFATISTGGYAPHDSSMGFYDNDTLRFIAIVFMTLASLNFSLHFIALRRRTLAHYWEDSEVQAFFLLILVTFVIIFLMLHQHAVFAHHKETAIETLFQVISIISTTGLTTEEYAHWPTFVPFLILMAGLIGGCAGSTSGGIKVVRVLLLSKQSLREIKRLAHPSALFPVKVNKKSVPNRVLDAVWGFLGFYLFLMMVFTFILLAFGLDFTTTISSVFTAIANVGPGLGQVAINFADLSDAVKWVLALAMLAGRLEVFTIIILLTPIFWRS